jgi:hypothetical protein
LLVILSLDDNPWRSRLKCLLAAIPIAYVTAVNNGAIISVLVLVSIVFAVAYYCTRARLPQGHMWDRSMLGLPKGERQNWYSSLLLWSLIVCAIFVCIYVHFW